MFVVVEARRIATAADVPGIFDVVINGEGYILASTQALQGDIRHPFGQAQYGFTPTFVQRQNVQGDYGDNFQDFWLTAAQHDWSAGDGQLFFETDNPVSVRKFYLAKSVDTRIPGQVTLRSTVTSHAATDAFALAAVGYADGGAVVLGTKAYALAGAGATTLTNLVSLADNGTGADLGAHGAGNAGTSNPYAVTTDGVDIYISAATKIRRYNVGTPGFSDFSATAGASALAFLNNTLFGFFPATGQIGYYDTAGTYNTVYTFKQANGTAITTLNARLKPFGGKLAALVWKTNRGSELYLCDTNGATVIESFPKNFTPYSLEELNGLLFISGYLTDQDPTNNFRPVVYYYARGTIGLLWESPVVGGATTVPMTQFSNGLVWVDQSQLQLISYDPAEGQTHGMGVAPTSTGTLVGGSTFLAGIVGATVFRFPTASSTATSGSVSSSQFDFGSSLSKAFRGIQVDAEVPTGASIDIDYQLDGLTGAWTSLQPGATAGTEYRLPIGTTGRTIAIRVTLNKGSSSAGPTVKRSSVRAAPIQRQFRQEMYLLRLTGRDGANHVMLRDGETHWKDGYQMAVELRNAAHATTPFTITDEFGSYTGFIDLDSFKIERIGVQEYVAVVPTREV